MVHANIPFGWIERVTKDMSVIFFSLLFSSHCLVECLARPIMLYLGACVRCGDPSCNGPKPAFWIGCKVIVELTHEQMKDAKLKGMLHRAIVSGTTDDVDRPLVVQLHTQEEFQVSIEQLSIDNHPETLAQS